MSFEEQDMNIELNAAFVIHGKMRDITELRKVIQEKLGEKGLIYQRIGASRFVILKQTDLTKDQEAKIMKANQQ